MPPPAFAPPRSTSRSASPSACSSPTTSRCWASTSSSLAKAGCPSSTRATWSAPSASAAPSRPTTTTRSPTPPPAIRTSPRRTEGDTDHGCQESLPRAAPRRGRDRSQRRRFRHGDLMSAARAFRGVIPAMAVPFLDDYKVDEDNLARFAVWLAGCRGVTAVMTNGHTGEVGSLLPDERAAVTRVVADAVKGAVRVVSAVCAEGTFEAVEHARAAAHAGADTVDVMPCHMWLRFGVKEDAVYEYVKTIGGESGLDVIVHVYPASTRAAYSTRLMVRLASIPQVKGFKMGERDLGAYERDIRALRADAPHVSLLNCMDEYLFATFVHRMDGTLVGCASLVPELINDLFEAMAADDLARPREINDRIS